MTAVCSYCGGIDAQTLDHVVAQSRGGSDDLPNITPACWSCNSSKNHLPLDAWLATDRLWAKIARAHLRQPAGQLALPIGSARRYRPVRDVSKRLGDRIRAASRNKAASVA